jgi:Mannosyltransferase (PIG-V)
VRVKTGWPRVLAWVLVVKAGYLAAVCVALWLWPAMDVAKFYAVMMHWPRTGGPVFASHFATWDAAHYLFLSEVGYGPGVRSDAFYPLWPLLVRWGSALGGGHDVLVGMVLANLLSAAAWVLFHRVTARRFGEAAANWALVWLVVFPGSLFYQFIYSEPLFFLLAMGLWYGLERRKRGVAWVSGLLLPLARAVGVFCLLPVWWDWLMRRPVGPMRGWDWVRRERARMGLAQAGAGRETGENGGLGSGVNGGAVERAADWGQSAVRTARGGARVEQQSVGRAGFAGGVEQSGRGLRSAATGRWLWLAPLAGWGLYFVLMPAWTGNPFEGIEAQKYWGVHSIGNLWNVPKFVIGWFTPTQWHGFTGSMLDRLMFLVLVYTLPMIWRLGKDLVVWSYVLAILPAMSGTFTSYTRFASVAFPMFIALAVFFERRKSPWLKWGLLAGFAVLHLVLLWRFVNFRWAG